MATQIQLAILSAAAILSASSCAAPVERAIPSDVGSQGAERKFEGRVLAGNGSPLARTPVVVGVRTATWDSSHLRTVRAELDEHGRFRCELACPDPDRTVRCRFELWAPLEGEALELDGPPRVFVDLLEPLAMVVALGDLELGAPGRSGRIRRLSDSELQREYLTIQSVERSRVDVVQRDACLSEMARRAGPLWIAFLEQEVRVRSVSEADRGSGLQEFAERLRADAIRPRKIAAVRAPDATERAVDPQPVSTEQRQNAADRARDLFPCLAALRRAQGAPDPIAIELDTPSITLRRGESGPRVRGRWRIVDRTEALPFQVSGDLFFGAVRIRDADGSARKNDDPPRSGQHVFVEGIALPGEEFDFEFDATLPALEPGDYALTLISSGSPYDWFDLDAEQRIVVSSMPIPLRVTD